MTHNIISSYLFRTSLYPFNYLQGLSKENIKELFKQSAFQEAIYLASPVLYDELQKWLKDELTEAKEVDKLISSLVRYASRMATRCTPFGLFAGFSLGQFTEEESENNYQIQLKPLANYGRHTRLDMNYLCALAQDIAKDENIKKKLKFYPNQSIYLFDEQLRYVEYKYINSRRVHTISAVDNSEYLQRIIQLAKDGALFDGMVNCIIDDEITIEDATEFVNQIIDNQILVNELEPAMTGDEFDKQLLQTLQNIPEAENIVKLLKETHQNIEKIDSSVLGSTVSEYDKIGANLKQLETKFERNYLFQVDMKKSIEKSFLHKNIENDLKDAALIVGKLCEWRSGGALSDFKKAFSERYEEKEVPLLEVMDNESGLGYVQGSAGGGDIAALVDDLMLPAPKNDNPTSDVKWSRKQSILFKKLKEHLTSNSQYIEITAEELKDIEFNPDKLPDTFSYMCRMVDWHNDLNKPIIQFSGISGSSAANLLGRFCPADEELLQYTRSITEKEQNLKPNAILAEIVHLPESRTGNVIMRPVLRAYEIPYLAKSAVEKEFQITPDDLMVSVRNNRVFLRSKRLNKEIIPRLSNAHNYSSNALPVYHFLCDVQNQDHQGGAMFDWGVLQNEFDYLPRLTYKNFVLATSTWNIKKEQVKVLVDNIGSPDLMQKVKEWTEKYKISQKVVLADSDNELYVDFSNELLVKAFISVIKSRGSFQLHEFIFNEENAVINGPEGAFTNEFIFAFHKN